MGYQWFPIPWIDGSSEEESKAGMMNAVGDLNAFLDALMVDNDLLPETVDDPRLFPRHDDGIARGTPAARTKSPVWLGFQAACLSLICWPMRSLCGRLFCWCTVIRTMSCRRNHCHKLPKPMQNAGWRDVYAHIMKGTAHGIAPDGLQVALAFMRDRLGYR